jgi:hypothetical protein
MRIRNSDNYGLAISCCPVWWELILHRPIVLNFYLPQMVDFRIDLLDIDWKRRSQIHKVRVRLLHYRSISTRILQGLASIRTSFLLLALVTNLIYNLQRTSLWMSFLAVHPRNFVGQYEKCKWSRISQKAMCRPPYICTLGLYYKKNTWNRVELAQLISHRISVGAS